MGSIPAGAKNFFFPLFVLCLFEVVKNCIYLSYCILVAYFLLLSHFSRCGILLLRLLGNQSVEEKFLFCKNVQYPKCRQSFLKKSFSIFFPYFLRMLHFFVSLITSFSFMQICQKLVLFNLAKRSSKRPFLVNQILFYY